MPLQHKHRPSMFKQVVGNKAVVHSLMKVLGRGPEEIPHAFLFSGIAGTGKTTLARIVRKKLGCSKHDFHELDSADFRGIETVRDIRRNMHLSPGYGPCRVYNMDECHQLTKDAQEGLLKALEDTPKHVFFILTTSEPEKLKESLKRRCSHHHLEPVIEEEVLPFLRTICEQEKKKVPDDVLERISIDCLGSPGIALATLDKIIDLDPEEMNDAAATMIAQQNESIELCRALIKRANWKEVSGIIKGIKQEPESVRRAVLGYASAVLLNGGNKQAFLILDCFARNYYDNGKAGLVMSAYESVHN